MIIDILCILFAIFGFMWGFRKGIVHTLMWVLAILIGVAATLKLSPLVITFLESVMNQQSVLVVILGFILTFVVVFIIMRVIEKLILKALKAIKLRKLDKIIGGVFMGTFFVLCFSVILWFLDSGKLLANSAKEQSISYVYLKPLPEKGKNLVKNLTPLFKDFWHKTMDAMDKAAEPKEE
jgi:membrane protein required for colicin V production